MAQVTIEPARILLRCGFTEAGQARAIPGGSWNRECKAWEYPISGNLFSMVLAHFPGIEVVGTPPMVPTPKAKAPDFWLDGEPEKEQVPPPPIKGVTPMAHQLRGYKKGITVPNIALFFEQGCGKSLTAVAIAGRRFLDGQIQKMLIIAPSSVVAVWPREFKDYAAFPYECLVLDQPENSRRVKALKAWAPDPCRLQVAVINYEAFRATKGEGKRKISLMGDIFASWGPDMILCDESQRLKTPGAIQSKALHKLAPFSKYRLILTGTPVTQGPMDFFSQYKFLDRTIFGDSFYSYRAKYAHMGGYFNKEITAYTMLPTNPDGRPNRYYVPEREKEFFDKAYGCAVRVTKAEALDLPPYTDQVLYCSLESKAAKLYRDMAAESVMELESGEMAAPVVLTKLLRLSQITGGYVSYEQQAEEGPFSKRVVEAVSNAKMALLEETLEDILSHDGKKVVIFGRFTPELQGIRASIEKLGVGYSFVDGSVSMADRGPQVAQFQEDPNIRVFLAQTQTAGLGITLTAADTAIFYSLDYSFANYDQARARIHRMGQKNACTYLHLVARGTVDEKVMEALQTKRNVADLVVDNWKSLFK